MSSQSRPRLWVVIPAAGVGRRMANATPNLSIPKQYLPLAGRAVIEWSIAPFLSRGDIASVVVVVSPDDVRFAMLPVAQNPLVQTALGGRERADSVARGLVALRANDDDWVLVHDAVRPCLHTADLVRLIEEVGSDAVGGLLGAPVADTLKSADALQRVSATVPRERLWRALTPQMFRVGLLRRALSSAAEAGVVVTDEAAAIERLGLQPKLVVGRGDNIKITVPEDLPYAEYVLQSQMAK
jgi:2-C-methyl-D-erythritol 4-phosphate cytidylyltransferase